MASPPPSRGPAAGGAPIALLVLAGTIVGVLFGQATVGFLVGLAVGVAIAIWVWLRDRG